MQKYFYLTVLLVFLLSISNGCFFPGFTGWKIRRDKSVDNKAPTESAVIELDIHGIEVLYFPMFYNRKWEHGFHEYVSEISSESGKLIILVKKKWQYQFPSQREYLKMIYKRSENQKELYFRSTCGFIEDENCNSIIFEIQKPANVRIEFYEDLAKTHFFTEEDYEQEMNERRFVRDPHAPKRTPESFFSRDLKGWAVCEETPTTIGHLPGIQPSSVVIDETPPTEYRERKAHTAEGSHHLDDPECARRRELFYQSVEEHNRRIRPF